MKKQFEPAIEVTPDTHYTPEVREWSLDKYKLVGSYCDIFTSGMKDKWNQLVYIDLFAGAGYVKVIEKKRVYKNSAFIAMSLPNLFSKYILCEQDPERFEALSKRVQRDYSHLNVSLIFGDSNKNIGLVKKQIPSFKKGNTLLPFCFVDPFSLNLKFETIKSMAGNLMDFLILQALHMDANRNFENYIADESTTISDYLGIQNWRDSFELEAQNNRKNFVKFLADTYQKQMALLGYQTTKHMHQIRSNEKNLPLYYLAFYSKHPRGEDFFKKVEKRIKPQLGFEF